LSGTQVTLQGTLFGNNEPGFTFEPWDITTLYQDRAGTTPVTAAGQSVGLRLDKSKGLALGPEVNPDPGFNNPAAWSFGGATPGWAVTGGKAECTATASANRWVLIPNLLTVGATYLITADVIVTAGSCAPDVSAVAAPDATTSGTKKWIVTASTPTLQFIGRSNFIGSIDNVSFKTIAGNHQVAVSDAKRGVYGWMPKGGRRNLLTYTEQFSDSAWALGGSTLSPNDAVAPDGTTTADKISEDSTTGVHRLLNNASITVSAGITCTWSVYVKSSERSVVRFVNNNLVGATFDLANGAASSNISAGITPAAVSVGNGWYRISISGLTATTAERIVVQMVVGGTTSYTGVTGSGIFVWGAQLELGSTATAYQRVASQYDITEAGVPTCYYVQADGVDDAYVTPTITPNTDKVQVFAGVRKLSDAASGIFIEHSASLGANNGAFAVTAPLNAAGSTFGFGSKGNAFAAWSVSGASFNAPVSTVLTGIGDISADTQILRLNGAQIQNLSNDQGAGNFLAYPAYIYGRGGTTLPFNGYDFGHAVRFGPNLDAATISRVEALIARNTPEVYL